MFTTKPTPQTDHQIVIDKIYSYLKTADVAEDNYGVIIDHLVKLQQLTDYNPRKLSADKKAVIATNIFSVLSIVLYERIHVISTKALSLMVKPT